ncbi:MAG: helix-turn-helix domain-containing protein [Acetobacteraceae bacterium]
MPDSPLATRIRDARRARGLTQDDVARAVGVSRSAVAQWETGRAGQLTRHLAALAAVLETGEEVLLHGAEGRAPALASTADELAMLRLFRECSPEDQGFLLRTARKMAKLATPG